MFPSSCSGNIFSFTHHPLHSPSKNLSSKHSPSQPFLVASTVQEVVPKKKSTTSMSASKKKTSGKMDRHSKIHTAHGVRHRRMRLSVQIARKFFDLQDMLGFDKASKTIDWLFTKSKEAIKELTTSSGCESTMSSVSHQHKDEKFRCYTFDPHAKESRESARARARERTRRKMVMRSLMSKQSSEEPNPKFLDDIAKFEESSTTHSLQIDQMTSGNYLATSSTSRSSPFIFSNFISNIAVSSGVNSSNELEGLSHDWCN